MATSARFLLENGPEAHASKFKQGKFSIFACVIQAAIIETGLILQCLYKTEIDYETILVVTFNTIQAAVLVYALLQIRALLGYYPELKEGNKMMALHLLIFNFFVLISIAYVFVYYYLYEKDSKEAYITCEVVLYT